MTNKWLIFTLFLAVMLFDGIIFPAFFGLREGFLTIIFLVAILLFCEINTQGLIFGVILSGLAEFYWGLRLGVLILPFLVSVGVLFLLNLFFNIRNKIFMIFSGLVLFIVFWETSVLISRII